MSEHMVDTEGLPPWLPDAVRVYLHHTEDGLSLRALARREGCHASTVLRQVRRSESRRDDPLWDEGIAALARTRFSSTPVSEDRDMTAPIRNETIALPEEVIDREARRILRRLAEPGAVLAIAPDMDKAAILRNLPDGQAMRTGVLDRAVAQAFALRDWIHCRKPGRIATYEITAAGRAALRRILDPDMALPGQAGPDGAGPGMAEAATAFADQHRSWGERAVTDAQGTRRIRVNLAESPVQVLARRRDSDGRPYLEPELVTAAERLREDFELAQMGPRVAQNWERFLTAGDRGGWRTDGGGAEGPRGARERVAAALRDLGPGLGDVALRCCCFLEGLEAVEKRMGWAARSGKIVLRIALMRLRRHYDETYGRSGPLIG